MSPLNLQLTALVSLAETDPTSFTRRVSGVAHAIRGELPGTAGALIDPATPPVVRQRALLRAFRHLASEDATDTGYQPERVA